MTGQETQGGPEGAATIRRLCQLGGVSRAGYYRHFQASAPARADADLRDAIQRISLAHRHYGYRRITAQLRREGLQFRRVRQFSPVQEVHDFLEGAVLDEIVDVVAEVAKFSVQSVHIAETGFICDDSFESFGYH